MAVPDIGEDDDISQRKKTDSSNTLDLNMTDSASGLRKKGNKKKNKKIRSFLFFFLFFGKFLFSYFKIFIDFFSKI